MAAGPEARAAEPLGFRQWKVNGEDGAAAQAGALGHDVAAVHVYDLLRDGETQPEAGVALPPGRVALTELFEDMRKKIRVDARARILHADHGVGV